MGKTNLVATCYVVVFQYDNCVMIKPTIHLSKPHPLDDRNLVRRFDNVFEAKKYIVANLGSEIAVRLAA